MPENNQILSVEGQLVGMPLAGPESFSQQQLDYLKRALGVDETVLFNNDTGSGSLTLSESPMNFERLKIFFGTPRSGTAGSNTGMSYTEVLTSTLEGGRQGSPSAGYLTLQGVFYGTNSSQSNPYITVGEFSGCNTTTWTRGSSGTIFKLSDKSVATDSQWVSIYKIIGVKRIAGGN